MELMHASSVPDPPLYCRPGILSGSSRTESASITVKNNLVIPKLWAKMSVEQVNAA